MILHPIQPIFDEHSRVLILGSFPSVRSREEGFFYGHPQNRFWKVISAVFGEMTPRTVTEKKAFLLRSHVALWDVIGSCDICGSADSSIRNVSANDLGIILDHADIRQIYVNGRTAFRYYRKHCESETGRQAVCLPSTSPANAAWSLERLTAAWSCIKQTAGGEYI